MTQGTFRTDSVLFMLLLVGVALIESALIFLPADTLGPIDEQLLLAAGRCSDEQKRRFAALNG